MTTTETREKPWRAWFIPNVPGKPFIVETATLAEARAADHILTEYSLFLGDDLIASSVGGVQKFESHPELNDWYDLDGDEDDERVATVTVSGGTLEERVERKRELRLLLTNHGYPDVEVR